MNYQQDDWVDRASDALLFLSFFVGGVWLACVLGYQVYFWLRYGDWLALPVSLVFEWFGADLASIYFPQSWFGLAKATQWVLALPASVALPASLVWVTWWARKRARGL